MPVMTKHGRRRVSQRNGVGGKSAEKLVRRAWKHGITHYEAENELKKMMDKTFLSHRNTTKIMFYGNSLYLFHNDIFITALTVGQNIMDDLDNNVNEYALCRYREFKEHIKRTNRR